MIAVRRCHTMGSPVAASAVMVPAVSSPVGGVEHRTSEEEVVAVGIAAIDGEMPVASFPVERAVEVGRCQIGIVLPAEEDVAQIEVTLLPISTVEIVAAVDAHEIIEVDLISGFILLFGQVQLIGHLVGKEEGLVTSLRIAHCGCPDR